MSKVMLVFFFPDGFSPLNLARAEPRGLTKFCTYSWSPLPSRNRRNRSYR